MAFFYKTLFKWFITIQVERFMFLKYIYNLKEKK